MDYPADYKYTKEHEWLRIDGDVVTIGITHHAQDALGDVVFVELPEVGASVERNAAFGAVESVKAVSELFSPVSGDVTEVNEAVGGSPEVVNESPHEGGWMIKVRMADGTELEALMGAADYATFVAEQG